MDPLKDLKDIHFPSPISWWPPGVAWFVLAGVVILLVLALVIWIWYRQRHLRLQKKALAELNKIASHLTEENWQEKIMALSVLLRRVAMRVYSREKVAGLTGQDWLRLLDQGVGNDEFSKGKGQLLVTAPYQKSSENYRDIPALLQLTKKWLYQVTKGGHSV